MFFIELGRERVLFTIVFQNFSLHFAQRQFEFQCGEVQFETIGIFQAELCAPFSSGMPAVYDSGIRQTAFFHKGFGGDCAVFRFDLRSVAVMRVLRICCIPRFFGPVIDIEFQFAVLFNHQD